MVIIRVWPFRSKAPVFCDFELRVSSGPVRAGWPTLCLLLSHSGNKGSRYSGVWGLFNTESNSIIEVLGT